MPFMLGRKPRSYNPRIPHWSALVAGKQLSPPADFDYSLKMPGNLGMMMNDQLGDCTCAGIYHGQQVWSANSQAAIDTESDRNVLNLYEKACGYINGNANTDQGGNEQTVLTYCMQQGFKDKKAPGGVNKITGFIEIDPRNQTDVQLAASDCGFVYIGFTVPAYLMPPDAAPPTVWDVNPHGDQTIVGGHCVILPGWTGGKYSVISWGSKAYRMTPAFFSTYVEEAYGLIDQQWINATGKTPAGLTLAQLQAQMSALGGG